MRSIAWLASLFIVSILLLGFLDSGKRDPLVIQSQLIAPEAETTPAKVPEPIRASHFAKAVPTSQREVLVLCVTNEEGFAVEGATVSILGRDAISPREGSPSMPGALDILTRIRRFGTLSATGPDGTVSVARPSCETLILATAEDAYGLVSVDAGATSANILLTRSRTIVVHVEEEDGRPAANVPLLIAARGDEGSPGPLLFRSMTDDRGLASLDDLPLHAKAVGLSKDALEVRVALPMISAPVAPLKGADVRLVLPATATLEVTVEPAATTSLIVRVIPRSVDPTGHLARSLPFGIEAVLPAVVHESRMTAGSTILARIALDEEYAVSVLDPSGARPPKRVLVAPAIAKGQQERVTVRWDDDATIVSGILRDEEGNPVRSTRLQVVDAPFPIALQSLGRLATNERGRLVFSIDDLVIERGLSGTVRLIDVALEREVEIAIPVLSRGPWCFGSATLRTVPLVAEGRVVDDRDQPIASARVWLAEEDDALHRAVLTGPDGRFRLRSSRVAHEASIRCVHPSYRSTIGDSVTSQGVPLGARDVVIRLSRTGSLTGRLLLPKGYSTETLEVTLAAEECATGVERDGSFRMDGIVPGDKTLSVRTSNRTLFAVPKIEVLPGRTTNDPRLSSIDLRELVQGYRVLVVDAEGEPLLEADLRVRDEGGDRLFPTRDEDHTWSLVTDVHRVELLATAPGYGIATLWALPGTTTVRLARGPSVSLEFASGLRLFDGPHQVMVTLTPVREDPNAPLQAGATPMVPFTTTWKEKLTVGNAGDYTVEVTVIPLEIDGRWREQEVSVHRFGTLVVEQVEGGQHHLLRPQDHRDAPTEDR